MVYIWYSGGGFIQWSEDYSEKRTEPVGLFIRLSSEGRAYYLHEKKESPFDKLKQKEVFDMIKDLGYFLYFRHDPFYLFILIISLVGPMM